MKQVYPADKHGNCLKGFCPTICFSNNLEEVVFALASNMLKYGIKYDKIVIEEV